MTLLTFHCLEPVNWSLRQPIQVVKLPATTITRFKIVFSLWTKWIRTVECGILAIEKLMWKTLHKNYIQFFQTCPLNTHKKKKKEKKFDCRRKRTFFYLSLFSIATSKSRDNDFLCFLSLHLFYISSLYVLYLLSVISSILYILFYLSQQVFFISFISEYTSRSWTNKSETLGKLSKYQSLWCKRCAG